MARKRRGRQLERVLRLIRKFTHARTGSTLADLMKEFEVSRRTMYRDLELLERSGFHFEGGMGDDGKRLWRFTSGQRRQQDFLFTDTELASLYFCMNLLAPFKSTPLRHGLETTLGKIEAGFNSKDRERYGDLLLTHVARLGPHANYGRHAATIASLSQACLDRRKIQITYRATGDETPKSYRFHPYCLAYAGGELYTIGYSEHRKGIRTLRIDRIQRIGATDQPFDRPQDFDPEDYLVRGFGMYAEGETERVRIEFAGKGAQAIRDKEWHPSQRIEERPDGKVILKMQVQGLSEVARWILYHAPSAKALEPPALKKLVAELAGEVLKIH